MSVVLAVCVPVVVVVVCVPVVVVVLQSRRLAVRERVVVNLVDGSAVAGVLWRRVGSWLVVRDAVVLEGGASAPADGEVLVHRSQVRFVQVTGQASA